MEKYVLVGPILTCNFFRMKMWTRSMQAFWKRNGLQSSDYKKRSVNIFLCIYLFKKTGLYLLNNNCTGVNFLRCTIPVFPVFVLGNGVGVQTK